MGRYAEDTRVTEARSREELYRVLARYGATETLLHEQPDGLRVGFVYQGLRIAVPVALPPLREFPSAAAHARERRRRWRVLLLLLKSRLELVASEAESAAAAFLPYLMLPDGGTVGDEVLPRVAEAQRTGRLARSLLPALPPPASATIIELPERTG